MKISLLFRNWWGILLQGILMIILSYVIFNNPEAVLASLALYIALIVIATGVIGMIAWFISSREKDDISMLFGNIAIFIIGLIMLSKMFLTMAAIAFVFGLLVSIVGLLLISVSWGDRKKWSLWWLIALLGASALITGIKSIVDIYSGAQNISTLIAIAVFLAGMGLIFLALLKKKILNEIGTGRNRGKAA